MAAPIVPGKEDAWTEWIGQLTGARKAEFEDFNTRHRLTGHRAWLQKNPDGSSLVIVVAEGAGAETMLGEVATSDNEFDKWFKEAIGDIHGFDFSAPPPPPAERKL